MKIQSANIPAWVWLVVSYAILASALFWMATHEASRITTILVIAGLLGCWIPAYVYANRRDIVQNKVFWISQSIAMTAGLIVFLRLNAMGD